MNGAVAQAASLVICGNCFLRGQDLGRYWPDASVFKYHKAVRFDALAEGLPPLHYVSYASDPIRWFARLRSQAFDGLMLQYDPVPNLTRARTTQTFVAGGGRMLLITLHSDTADAWDPQYQYLRGKSEEDSGWDVVYRRILQKEPYARPVERNFEPLRLEFGTALKEIEEFARAEHQGEFADIFERASDALQCPEPRIEYYPDIDWLDRLPLSAKQLLMAAQIASVFAGEGSWNDIGFKGSAEVTNRQLSDRVFALLMRAIVESANASCPGSINSKPS